MISRIIATIILIFLAPALASAQPPQRGRGDGQRGSGQRGSPQNIVPQRGRGQGQAPPTYYGGGVWSGGRGAPGGRFWRGQYYTPGVGPCWVFLPVVGFTWTCQ